MENSIKPNQFVVYITVISVLSYLPTLFIDNPLWDDWILKFLTFDEMVLPFKMNGGYNVGIPFLHNFFNKFNHSIQIQRIFSLVLIAIIPYQISLILKNLNINIVIVNAIVLVIVSTPLFANSFPQINLPYLICYTIYLSCILYMTKYIRNKEFNWSILLLFLPLSISYVTNSLLFHIVPLTILIFVYYKYASSLEKSKAIQVSGVIFLSVLAFFTYKTLFMQTSGSYQNYNKITLKGLLFEGPKVTALTLLYIVKGYIDILVLALKNITHLIILAVTSTVIYHLLKRIGLGNLNLTRKYIYVLAGVGLFLFAIGIYPYGVVGKTALSYQDWAQRHLMLVPVGIAFMLVSFILLLPNTNLKIGGLAILLSSFLLIRVYVLVQFYHAARLQQAFIKTYQQLPISNEESYLFVIDNQPQAHLIWRFYEFGGLLRQQHLKSNKLFLYASGKYVNGLGKLNMDKLEPDYLNEAIYGIQDFNSTNYQTKHITLSYQSTLSIPDFLKSLFMQQSRLHDVKITLIN
jgi:hypothetical protein